MNIGNMVVRMILRKIIGMGINKGVNMASGATRKRRQVSQMPDTGEMWDGEDGDIPVQRPRNQQRRKQRKVK